MNTYTCVYTDVDSAVRKRVDHVHGQSPEDVFVDFIQRRKAEGWTYADIFTRSRLRITNHASNTHYTISRWGEVQPIQQAVGTGAE